MTANPLWHITEAKLDEAVRDLIKLHGLYGYHTYDSRRSEKGWPDWVIIGDRIIYRELKGTAGNLTSEQKRVRYLIQAAGGDWDVWRPVDLASGRIASELRDLAVSSRHSGRGNASLGL